MAGYVHGKPGHDQPQKILAGIRNVRLVPSSVSS
jgi:hypothetical protein